MFRVVDLDVLKYSLVHLRFLQGRVHRRGEEACCQLGAHHAMDQKLDQKQDQKGGFRDSPSLCGRPCHIYNNLAEVCHRHGEVGYSWARDMSTRLAMVPAAILIPRRTLARMWAVSLAMTMETAIVALAIHKEGLRSQMTPDTVEG